MSVDSSVYFRRFDQLHADEYIEVRLLKYKKSQQFWVKSDQIPTDILKEADASGWNVYAGVNPRRRNRGTKAAITSVVAYHVDLDSKSLFEWPDDLPKPTMSISSGSGKHFYWELDEPVEPSPNADGINSGLALKLGGDKKTRDISRVLRIPGFRNHKNGYSVELIEAHDFRYKPEDFSHLAIQLDGAPRQIAQQTIYPLPSIELRKKFEHHHGLDHGLRRAWRGECGDGSSDSRYAAVCRLVETKAFTLEEIGSLVLHKRWFNRYHKALCTEERVYRDVSRLLGLFAAEQREEQTEVRGMICVEK